MEEIQEDRVKAKERRIDQIMAYTHSRDRMETVQYLSQEYDRFLNRIGMTNSYDTQTHYIWDNQAFRRSSPKI